MRARRRRLGPSSGGLVLMQDWSRCSISSSQHKSLTVPERHWLQEGRKGGKEGRERGKERGKKTEEFTISQSGKLWIIEALRVDRHPYPAWPPQLFLPAPPWLSSPPPAPPF